ncbi:hypothetical protein GGX14DRAFT_404739 [Mycena pura]|uniref:Uncharacterized protein n=1 Tax=Mycena pura TaxID=153505 RepID=A0AAD6UXA9_9AGAR|nr:hypothetical protein GGX14DRAFT_404739 [Mycena pura]
MCMPVAWSGNKLPLLDTRCHSGVPVSRTAGIKMYRERLEPTQKLSGTGPYLQKDSHGSCCAIRRVKRCRRFDGGVSDERRDGTVERQPINHIEGWDEIHGGAVWRGHSKGFCNTVGGDSAAQLLGPAANRRRSQIINYIPGIPASPREHQAIPDVGYPAVVPARVLALDRSGLDMVWHRPASYLLAALGASPLGLQRHANTYIAVAMSTKQPIISMSINTLKPNVSESANVAYPRVWNQSRAGVIEVEVVLTGIDCLATFSAVMLGLELEPFEQGDFSSLGVRGHWWGDTNVRFYFWHTFDTRLFNGRIERQEPKTASKNSFRDPKGGGVPRSSASRPTRPTSGRAPSPAPPHDDERASGIQAGRNRHALTEGGSDTSSWQQMSVNVAGVDSGSEHEVREGAGGAEALIPAAYLSA